MDLEKTKHKSIFYNSSECMKELDSDSIDAIITSPPYNRKINYSDDSGNWFDDNQSNEAYIGLLKSVFKECFRILKVSGLFFLNIGDSANDQAKSELVAKMRTVNGSECPKCANTKRIKNSIEEEKIRNRCSCNQN